MYRVESKGDETWAVIGPDEQSVFTGSLRDCEDWLDQKENEDRLARRTSWWTRILNFFRGSTGASSSSSQTHDRAAANPVDESKSTPAA